jgi:hypothetical protein
MQGANQARETMGKYLENIEAQTLNTMHPKKNIQPWQTEPGADIVFNTQPYEAVKALYGTPQMKQKIANPEGIKEWYQKHKHDSQGMSQEEWQKYRDEAPKEASEGNKA